MPDATPHVSLEEYRQLRDGGASERDHQEALFEWARAKQAEHPELATLYAVPNGQYRPGERPEAGLKAGVPDVCLPVPRGEYGSLYIELKVGSNQPTATQKAWITLLREHGAKAVVCYGWDEAAETITDYLTSDV